MRVRLVVTVYLIVVAFLLGMVAEKVRFSFRRDAVMREYEAALAEWRAAQVRAERAAADAVEARHQGAGALPGGALPAAGSPSRGPLDDSVLPPLDR